MYKSALTALIAIVLTGCASGGSWGYGVNPKLKSYTIEIEFVDHSFMCGDVKAAGCAYLNKNDGSSDKCKIKLVKKEHVLLHELKHCFEGNWH
jgi:hypothetical protein